MNELNISLAGKTTRSPMNFMSEDDQILVKIHPEAARRLDHREEDIAEFTSSCICEHYRILSSNNGSILKNSPESAVTIVDLPDSPRVCVKELRWRGWVHALKGLFRPTRGLRTFRNAWRLQGRGVSVAAALVWASRQRFGVVTSEWVIMEVIPGAIEMDRYLVKKNALPWNLEEKRGLTRLFGRFMGTLHGNGIFHSDLKTCNILVSEDYPGPGLGEVAAESPAAAGCHTLRFSLLDYDDVLFLRDVPRKKRVKNLGQLFLSVPVSVRAAQRLRFLSEYALHVGIGAKDRRGLALEVLTACRGKDILYVGPSGDVNEKWD
jgi:tRNA A-37 threonylcarbamoyl transferase component Bud32